MLTKLVGKLASGKVGRAVGLHFAGAWLRDVAEGKRGEALQRWYLRLAGRKREIGAVLLVAALACTQVPNGAGDAAGALLASVGTALVSLGFFDAGWRGEMPAFIRESALGRWVGKHVLPYGTEIGAVFALVAWRLDGCGDAFAWRWDNCTLWSRVVVVLAGTMVQLGWMPAAWKARPPGVPEKLWDALRGEHTTMRFEDWSEPPPARAGKE